MKKSNWDKISTNPKVIELLKERERINKEIKKLQSNALLKYEIYKLET